VYLAHPLLLQGLLWGATAAGVLTVVQSWPSPIALTVLVGVGVPVLYLASAGLTIAARRSPLSLLLTGRRRLVSPAPELIAPATSTVPTSAEPSMAGAA